MSQNIPSTFRGLVCQAVGQPLSVQSVPTPDAVPGSVVIRVVSSIISGSTPALIAGHLPFKFPTPFIPGGRGVGRVAAVGADVTTLQIGQLVLVEPFIRGRDDPDVQILWGMSQGPSPASKKLMEDAWRNGMFAEYTRVPLENCHVLNEKILLGSLAEGGFGYDVADLVHLSTQLVAYGGFRGIDLKAGETVIVAPATGAFSGAAVEVASAMGAQVIAVGRNLSVLQRLAESNSRVKIVQMKGNVEEDCTALQQFGKVDVYLDISPPAAAKSTHVRSCLMALKPYGRASLMGVLPGDIPISYVMAMYKNLTIRGQYMYQREDARGIIKLAETGALKLGKSAGIDIVGRFPLEEWEKAFETSVKNTEAGKEVVFMP